MNRLQAIMRIHERMDVILCRMDSRVHAMMIVMIPSAPPYDRLSAIFPPTVSLSRE